ncbi:sensor histidine kinase [Paenibacillus piri]|uniref:HAMP domain-containing protein n=1 Tax=Paenibacillus piri TaxID=2547395 RepID=A0A4R5KXB6_9BACL|nr:histidine kinase [Paenibacillus piri]TDG00702.1 HAMP domain-containing protein [Paenibacillus piri]
MKRFIQNGKGSLFPKLALRFLIVILPFYILSLLMNDFSQSTTREQLLQLMASRTEFYLDSIETDIGQLMHLQKEYFSDTDLHNLSELSATMSDYEKSSAILRLQEKLRMIKNTSKYTKKVEVYIPSLGRLIEANDFSNEPAKEEMDFLRKTSSTYTSHLLNWNGKLLMGVPYQIRTDARSEPIFYWGIELSHEKMSNALLSFADYSQGGAILINPQESWDISNYRDDPITGSLAGYFQNMKLTDEKSGQGVLNMNRQSFFVTYKKSELLGMLLAVYVPEKEVIGPLQKFRIWFWLLSLLAVITIVIYSYWLFRFIHQPMRILTRAFRKVESGNLNAAVQPGDNGEFNYLFDQFNVMVSKLKILIHEVYEHKTRLQRSELKQLQSQINPHFLYNSFFILYRMAKKQDIDKLLLFTKHLGDYFQFITRNHSDEVTLKSEIHHARVYGEIQSVRFSNRITVNFEELPACYNELQVPRLVLQPLIENAFLHGLEHKLEEGRINVAFVRMDDFLSIMVEDNGDDLDAAELKRLQLLLTSQDAELETTGMLNVHRRLQIRYGKEGGLRFSIGELGGLRIEMKLPVAGAIEPPALASRQVQLRQ